MGRARPFHFLLLTILLSAPLRADHDAPETSAGEEAAGQQNACPSWIKEPNAAPPCPPGGGSVLPDTFPALAHVVSDDFNPAYGNWPPNPNLPYWKDIKSKMAAEFTLAALKSSDPKTPLILLPVHDDTFKRIRSEVEKATEGDSQKRTRWLGALHHLRIPPLVYLQDPMKAVRGKDPGTVQLSPIPSYLAQKTGEKFTVESLAAAAHSICPLIRAGAPILLPKGEKQGDGYAGGNIVGLPGGLVTRSLNQSQAFADQYSGSRDNQVDIDTSWLYVGHADEIVNTVANPKGKEPCNFAIAIASPKKAMELLSAEEHKHEPFIVGAPGSKVISQTEENGYRRVFSHWWICNPWREYQGQLRAAAGKPMTSEEGRALLAACEKKDTGEIAQLIKEFPQFNITYELAQRKLDAIRKTIEARLDQRLPACKGQIKFIDVPMLYQPMYKPVAIAGAKANEPIEKRYRLPPMAVRSWLPNMLNGVGSGNALISPFPHNKLFKDYMEETFREMGAANLFIDDYYYAHMGSGNVHCATHTMRFCK